MSRTMLAAIPALALWATTAQAQVLTLSTTNPGGLAHSIGSSVAKVVTDATDLRMVVVPAGGAPMPPVVAGEADCGINSDHDVSFYASGSAFYADEGPHPNLRMVAAVLPSLVSVYVRADSDIRTLADLKGKRVPGGLNAQLAIGAVYETMLALGGLGRDDVETVPAASITQAADDFAAGRNDAFVFSVGTAKVLEVESAVGGLRALGVKDSEANRALLAERLPGADLALLEAGSAPQIVEPTSVIRYDLVLFCADTVPDEAVAKMVTAIHDNPAALAESFAAMARFKPADMAPAVPGLAYHPGALAAYSALGIVPAGG